MFQKRLGNDEIRQRFAKKAGHWQVVYPSIDEIEILKSRATVKCLDCGQETDVDLANFIGRDFFKRGCTNCKMLKAQKEHVAAIEKKTQDLGYEIFDLKMFFYNQLYEEGQCNWEDRLDIFFGEAGLGDKKDHKYAEEKHEIELWFLKEIAQYKDLDFAAPAIKRSLEGDIDFEDSNRD